MKKLLFIILLLTLMPIKVPDGSDLKKGIVNELYAGTTCSRDMLGNYNCYSDSGYRSSWNTDMIGNLHGRDNQGNHTTCYTDMIGNLRCY